MSFKRSSPFEMNIDHRLKKSPSKFTETKFVPENVCGFISRVKPEKKNFVWVINEITNIRKLNLWTVPNCQFEAGGCMWNLSLYLSANGNSLLARPEILEPKSSTATYFITFHVVNQQQRIVYSSPFVCEHPVVSDNHNVQKSPDSIVKWEVLRFNEGPIDQFNNLVFNDSLKLMVEMTVFKDVKNQF